MKLKSLLVITLFVVACSFASAQTFGFASTGGGLYCNYEQLTNAGTGFYGGLDNLSACGLSVNGTLSGFLGSVKNEGGPGIWAGVTYGDSVFAAEGLSLLLPVDNLHQAEGEQAEQVRQLHWFL